MYVGAIAHGSGTVCHPLGHPVDFLFSCVGDNTYGLCGWCCNALKSQKTDPQVTPQH
jgi:hypothetical protein